MDLGPRCDGNVPLGYLLFDALTSVEESPYLPRVVVLYGETGRGKTFAVQRFYDELCQKRPGPWQPGLTPAWPPTSTSDVDRQRKKVRGKVDANAQGQMPFYWLGIESYAYGRDPADPAPSPSEQISSLFRSALARNDRKKKIGAELLRFTLDAIAVLSTPLGYAKTAYDHGTEIAKILRNVDDALDERRQAVHKGFSAISRTNETNAPMIVVIDDAQDIDRETLFLLSGLITPRVEPLGGEDRSYLPDILGQTMASPLLFVCTAWEHRVVGDYEDPFLLWLGELDGLGIPVDYYECNEFERDEADAIVKKWAEVPDDVRRELLAHVSYEADQKVVVNPLVLNLGIAHLEQRRDAFTGLLTASSTDIIRLPVTPEDHIRDRLDLLRGQQFGPLALAILEICSALGHSIPARFIELAASEVDPRLVAAALSLLDRHELAIEAWDADGGGQDFELRVYRFDIDVTRFLANQPRSASQTDRLARMCSQFLEWLYFDLTRQDFELGMVAMPTIDSIASPVAKALLLCQSVDVTKDAALIAHVLARSGDTDLTGCSVKAIGFAYARGVVSRLGDDQLIAAFESLWVSRIAIRIAERRLMDGVSHLDGPVEQRLLKAFDSRADTMAVAVAAADVYRRHNRPRQALALLETHSAKSLGAALLQADIQDRLRDIDKAVAVLRLHHDESAALKIASLLVKYGRKAAAVSQLEKLLATSDTAAIVLARLIEKDDPERACEILVGPAERDHSARCELARILAPTAPDRALEILNGVQAEGAFALAADLHLAEGRNSEAIATLQGGADRYSNIAIRLSNMLIEQGDSAAAICVLEVHASTASNAATSLAEIYVTQGDVPAAVEVLRPVADRFQNAAIRLAPLIQTSEPETAVRLLSIWADNPMGYRLLVLSLLRCDRPEAALEILDARLSKARDRQTQHLRASANWLKGDTAAGLEVFKQLDSRPDIRDYYRWVGLFTNLGHLDPLVVLVQEGLHFQRDRAVADFVLTAAARAGNRSVLTEYCDKIWPTGRERQSLRRRLVGSLWAWTRDADSVQPPMPPKAALSCLEVVGATGGLPVKLRAAMHEAFTRQLKGDARSLRMVSFFAAVSEFAANVRDDLSQLAPTTD